MAKKGCYICGGTLRDHDGSIVYDVFRKKELLDYISENLKEKNPILQDIIIYEDDIFYNDYFWKCQDCHTVYVWNEKDDEFQGSYLLKENYNEKIDLNDIKNLEEIFIVNLNDEKDNLHVYDLFEKNPFRPYKYYISKDLKKIYIIDTNNDILDRIYELDEDVLNNLYSKMN